MTESTERHVVETLETGDRWKTCQDTERMIDIQKGYAGKT
jgi:hypothetical protein